MTDREIPRQQFWNRSMRRWDLALVGMAAIDLAAILIVPSTSAQRLIAMGMLAMLGTAYMGLARPGIRSGATWRIDTYLAILVLVTATSIAMADSGYILLFIAFSHIWFLAHTRLRGILWSTALTGAVVLASAVLNADLQEGWADTGAQMLAALGFSIGLGLWITQLAETSETRAALLEELRAAQASRAASERAAGVLAERERLAQEIHDTLAQGFTSVVMLTQTVQGLLDQGRIDEIPERLAQIEAVARDNLAEARSLVVAFGPAVLRDHSFEDAMDRVSAGFSSRTGIPVHLDLNDQVSLDTELVVVLLRTTQEALTNVARHAQATDVHITLRQDGQHIMLDVRDDGRGLPDQLIEGYGLIGMRERAAARGGSLSLGPVEPHGTHLRLAFPNKI